MTVLFVCTGNTCRSPMAEGFFNLLDKGMGMAQSCGLCVSDSGTASANAITAAAEFGADIKNHVPKSHSQDLISKSDYIYCVTPGHAAALSALYPDAKEKIFSLSPPISDPFGFGLDVYLECARELFEAVRNIVDSLYKAEPAEDNISDDSRN